MTESPLDTWRQAVSESLGEIKADIRYLVDNRRDDSARITALEIKQNRRDGVIAAALIIVPFLTEPIKKFFGV
jgi:hypothetical protein